MYNHDFMELPMNTNNQIPFFAANAPFEIVYRKGITPSPVKPHTHNALEIYFTLNDLPDVLLNDTVSSVESGSLIIIPPYCVHQLFNTYSNICERYIITINSVWLNHVFSSHPELIAYANQNANFNIIKLSGTEQETLCSLLNQFVTKADTVSLSHYTSFFYLLETVSTIITKQDKMQNSVLSISSSQQTVNRIIAFINENLTHQLTLDDIASHFYMNKDYMARIFKEHTHASIGHYISLSRANMAQQLLAEGMTVPEVQEVMGFTSYAYFFKFFKKMTGVSPSQYRKK